MGRSFRAVSDDREIAELMGLNARKVYAHATALAFVLVGLAGVLQGLRTTVSPADGQPGRIDTDHRSNSRSHAVQDAAPWRGQFTVTDLAPRRTSMRMSSSAFAGTGSGLAASSTGICRGSATNSCGDTGNVPRACSRIQR